MYNRTDKSNTHLARSVRTSRSAGFSLVEILVSISIFVIFVIAASGTITDVSRQSKNSANKERAAVLVEEAFEASRNIRDANFDNLIDGSYGLSTSSNMWNFSGTSDLTDLFTRVINISTISPDQKKISVAVSWADQASTSNTFSMSTYLTRWRTILNNQAGLTVNKSVVNHGGSKVAADFAPYMAGTTTLTVGVASMLDPGSYTITESVDPNYIQTFSGDCDSGGNITLGASTTNTCLITNEEKPSRLTVTKVVTNHGLSKTISDFTLLVDANPVTSGVTNTFNSGIHTVSEVADSSYNTTFSGDCNSIGSVTLAPNTTKACTLTNEENLASIYITKTVINHGDSKVAADFQPYQVGNASGTTTVSLNATTTKNSGTYYVSEVIVNKYTKTYSGDCNASGLITLTSGTTKYCHLTNEEVLVNAVPDVTTPTVSSITNTTATLGATVTSLGVPASISARGTCWGTSPSPTTNCVAEGNTTTGAFTQARTGLAMATTYYYRGYATNTTGTGYSADGTFTTTGCSTASSVVGTPTLYDSASSNSALVSKPTGVTTGDIMFAHILHNAANNSDRLNAIPTGWVQIARHRNGNYNQALYYHVADAAEGANYTFGFSGNIKAAITVSAYRGCFNTANPIAASSSVEYVANNTTYRADTMTLPSANSTILMFPSMFTTTVRTFANPLTQSGGWTEDYDQGSTASDFSRAGYRKFMSASGATNVIDSIGQSGSTVKHAFGVGLTPIP